MNRNFRNATGSRSYLARAESQMNAPVYPTGVYLAAVAEVIRTKGFLKEMCAADAFQLVVANKDGQHEFAVEDWTTAANAIGWFSAKDVRPGFESDLLAAISSVDIAQNKMKLAMYCIKMYTEEADKVEANKEFAASSSHLGSEGGKLALSVQIDSSEYSSSEWGVSYFTKAHTEDGNVIAWYAKTEQTVGTIVDLTGKVKAHKVWGGVNVTVLNFVKIS